MIDNFLTITNQGAVVLGMPSVLSWCCSVVLECTSLHSIVLHFNMSPNVQYFPILIWQKWTKNWTKVMFCGYQVPTKVTIKRD